MTIITYSLKAGERNSDRFYKELAGFTDVIIATGERRLESLVVPFEAQSQGDFSPPEIIFDLLALGVLWREYGPEAVKFSPLGQRVLAGLVSVRRSAPRLKPAADFLRGVFGWAFRLGDDGRGRAVPLTMDSLSALIDWLEAAGEFKEEVLRIRAWHEFLSTQPDPEGDLAAVAEFAEWFAEVSLDALGSYTPNVERFLAEKHPRYRGREDYVFTGRKRVEYHLYMIGAEIMNRAFREAFQKTNKRILFVPPCMSAPQDGVCQAVDTPLGARCAHCTPSCQVHQITKLGEKLGVEVFMIPDSFSPLSSGGSRKKHSDVGVIGVSCPLTITAGGWEMKRLGIPAQGLLLDHCGCSWHWDPGKGIVTEINFGELRELLGEK